MDPMVKVVGPKKKKPLPSFVREKDMDRLLDESLYDEGLSLLISTSNSNLIFDFLASSRISLAFINNLIFSSL